MWGAIHGFSLRFLSPTRRLVTVEISELNRCNKFLRNIAITLH